MKKSAVLENVKIRSLDLWPDCNIKYISWQQHGVTLNYKMPSHGLTWKDCQGKVNSRKPSNYGYRMVHLLMPCYWFYEIGRTVEVFDNAFQKL